MSNPRNKQASHSYYSFSPCNTLYESLPRHHAYAQAQGYRYIIAARDDLSGAAEGRKLKRATARTVSQFIFEELICRYGAISEIITDNGPEVKGATEELLRRHGIPQIHISPYNSQANGVVERGHFTIREGLVKACEGKIN